MMRLLKYFSIISLLIILSLTVISCSKKNKPFIEGDQSFKIKDYNLEQQGFEGLENIFRQHVEMPNLLLVENFDGDVSKDGILEDFTMLLYGYNNSKEYVESYRFTYDSKKKEINYAGPKSDIKTNLLQTYNENSEISFLDKQLKNIPISNQIQKLDFKHYTVSYSPNRKPSEGDSIIDGTSGSDFPVLTFNDYKAGKGGKSDGHTAVIFTLHDGASSALGENRILYSCTPANIESLYGNKNSFMKKDYYINGYKIKLTRDYGETWIELPISEEDLANTLEFYRLGIEIPQDSYYISDNPGGTIGFLYGKNPTLLLSKNDGVSWNTIDLNIDLGKPITRRTINFISETDGCIALGTDWSMGSGEGKSLYFTNDGGETWEQKKLPLQGTSSTLTGVRFADRNIGILSLDGGSNATEPILFLTTDRGEAWEEINLPWSETPEDIQYLTKVDSLTYVDGIYKLILGQDSSGNEKAVFKSKTLEGDWKFEESYESVGHYTG